MIIAWTRPAGKGPPGGLGALVADAGVRFNGDAPWDIQVRDARLYRMIVTHGSLGFGEGYVDGLWECERLDELFHRLLNIDADEQLGGSAAIQRAINGVRHKFLNLQAANRAFWIGNHHYDIGNDIFEAMLDPTMSYSCAYWAAGATDLALAQRDKLELICRKLALRPGERLLDIGCGWGGLAAFAARHYKAEVFGITVSKEQQAVARERCAGLPVTIELMDYRNVTGRYDKVVSVGMFEHVGPKNYRDYFDVVQRVLDPGGLFLLQTIGTHKSAPDTDPWIEKYIFPNAKLPSARDVASGLEGRFVIEDWHSFGPDYDLTLMAWWENFRHAWPGLEAKYGERFYRMWKYYLMSCAGFFRSRQGQLWQVVLSGRHRSSPYRSVR